MTMTTNFDIASLFSFSTDSCGDDDDSANNFSRLSYLTVTSGQLTPPDETKRKKFTNAKLGKLINCQAQARVEPNRDCKLLEPSRVKSRIQLAEGDSISLSEAASRSRPQTTIGVKRASRCVSAKFGPTQNELEAVMMKDVVKKGANEERARSPPPIMFTNVTVDTSKAKSNSDVIRMCLNELGWMECPKGGVGCDIVWQSCTTSHEGRDLTSNAVSSFTSSVSGFTAKLNKFPGMNQLLRKGPLTQSLNAMRLIFTSEYDFYPKTWFLPEQLNEFAAESKYMNERQLKTNKPRTIFIVKPNDGSQGDGIYLIDSVDEYLKRAGESSQRHHKMHIVQEYIHNPYLIDGLKSDLRIYVVILSLRPLQIYIYDEGLVRFATVDYQTPNEKNLNQIYMHLTNYSLNKKNDSYKFTSKLIDSSETKSQGSKRKLTSIFESMAKKGVNISKIKAGIDDLVVKTVIALLPEMKVESAFETVNSHNKPRTSCFQIIGFDILIRDDFKPMLLEVNCNPSLRIDYEIEAADGRILSVLSPIDFEIKKPLVLETLKLVAPVKKLEIMQKLKREEQQKQKEAKLREQLVRQRMEQRLMSAKKIRTIDFEKCPLLSKPGDMYIKSKLLKQKPQFKDSLLEKSLDSLNMVENSAFCVDSRSSLNFGSNSRTRLNGGSLLRLVYPPKYSSVYDRLKVVEHIADIFMCFSLFSRSKFMSHFGFRSFIKQCNLIGEKLSADNLDIIFFELNKKWEFYNRKKPEIKGLCFQAFVECFYKLSRLIFDDATTNVESVKSLIYYCKYFLKLKGVRPNEFFELELDHDPVMSVFKPSAKLSALINQQVEIMNRNIALSKIAGNRSASVLSNSNNDIISQTNSNLTPTKRLEKYKLDEKKSVFPIFF